ncbi:hypothetical protein CEXT_581631 [Caerostris extrusa]|uniref:Uncharacterized protein n=1 Tax=Caerostris extrusa TaxID=172846 RepID=A0AAV4XKD2_CAEEX|nr:hypothetical protein CEXT_581631 [Caerostris extrusa]
MYGSVVIQVLNYIKLFNHSSLLPGGITRLPPEHWWIKCKCYEFRRIHVQLHTAFVPELFNELQDSTVGYSGLVKFDPSYLPSFPPSYCHPSFHPSYPPSFLTYSVHPSVLLPTFTFLPSLFRSFHPSIRPSSVLHPVHPSFLLSVRPSHLPSSCHPPSVLPTFLLYFGPSILLSVNPSFSRPSFRLSFILSFVLHPVLPSICPSYHPSFLPSALPFFRHSFLPDIFLLPSVLNSSFFFP